MIRGLLAVLVVMALPACESKERIAADPPKVLVTKQEERLPLTVTAAGSLTGGSGKEAVIFLQSWRDRGWGPLAIETGRLGAEAGARLKAEVAALARRVAADPSRIVAVAGGVGAALRFDRASAVLPDCGEDYATAADFPGNPNRAFGCATRRNLGAMVANPADLVDPRLEVPEDAARGAKVIETHRKGPVQAAAPSQAVILPVGTGGK